MDTHKLINLVTLATSVVELSQQCSAGPWDLKENYANTRGRRLVITSPQPWRRRPPVTSGFGYEEHADVAEVKGGMCDEAKANGHLMALSREALPALGKAVIELALQTQQQREARSDTVPDVPLPLDLAAMRSASAMNQFFEDFINAIDRLFEAAGVGHVSDRNADAIDRLLSGDGLAGDCREQRYELLAAVVAVLNPATDDERLKKLPQQFRLPNKAKPKRQDFIDAIPAQIRAGLRGESTYATDAELLEAITATTTPDEIKQRIRRAKLA